MLGDMNLRLLAPALAAALVLGACSDDGGSTTDSSAKKGESKKIVEISPLTGQPMPDGKPDNPVFVVKIENTVNGEPQYAVNRADLVIEELVEGGLTRLAALFYSELPTKVGHVRSLRTTDVGIAKPVAGKVVASGGAPKAARQIRRAGIRVFSESSPGFHRDAKAAPYNVIVNLKKLGASAKVNRIPGPYLSWTPPGASKSTTPTPTPDPSDSASAPPEPKKATRATVRFSNGTSTRWKYSGDHWKRKNGHAAPGQEFAADTLIVMFCRVGDAGYRDPAGNPVPETFVEGSGRAVVLHDGIAVEGKWNKPSLEDKISFEAEDGKPLTIDPGKVWIELAPKGDGKINY
jgi:hypothetical protein